MQNKIFERKDLLNSALKDILLCSCLPPLLLPISMTGWRAGSMGEGKCSISTFPPFTTACSIVRKNFEDLYKKQKINNGDGTHMCVSMCMCVRAYAYNFITRAVIEKSRLGH